MRALRSLLELADRERLEDPLLDRLEPVVVLVEDASGPSLRFRLSRVRLPHGIPVSQSR